MGGEPEHHGILAVDIEGFGRLERGNPARVQVRAGLYRALDDALAQSAVPTEFTERTDHGDSVLVLFDPRVSKTRLLHPLVPQLASGLARYNRAASELARMRLRAVIHAGEILRDAHGVTGEDLNVAFRLLGADVTRAVLAQGSRRLGARRLRRDLPGDRQARLRRNRTGHLLSSVGQRQGDHGPRLDPGSR
jgi:hypothetical protein